MAKWKFALLVFLGTGVNAHELAPQTDGCALLDEIIYEEVTAAGWGISGSDLVFTNFREPSVVICTDTTQTVSKAFVRAVRAIGGGVEWEASIGQRVDTCLSGFIERCLPRYGDYPRRLSGTDPLTSWKAVSDTVRRAMPEGSAADRSIFSEASMRRAVRNALR